MQTESPKTTSAAANASAIDNNVKEYSGFAPAYNGVDRNAWLIGWTPQQELWNGRLAMIGFVAYLLWDAAGYSVLRDVLHLLH
ncbi:high light inducible protein [Phormidium tenue FACHB-886]|nr:high light inducible protein [Phormidium tenue FACHB-886]